MYNLYNGDILLARNGFGANPTPGHWNHVAIVGDSPRGLCVVEVQAKFPEVVAFGVESFLARYAEVALLLAEEFVAAIDSVAAAKVAVKSVGVKIDYAVLQRKTAGDTIGEDNCVSFLRKCFFLGAGTEKNWRKPDDLLSEQDFSLRTIKKVENIREWSAPDDKWSGRLEW